MKILAIGLFMLLSAQLFAQRVNGLVIDKVTGKPVANATISKGYMVQQSAYDGYFSLNNLHFGDSIKVTRMGYKPYGLAIGVRIPDTLRVYLEENSIMLNSVNINSKHDNKLDSANVRREFAKIFAYKPPTISDAFLTIDPYAYTPSNYIIADHSTASLVGIDLLAVASVFGDIKTRQTELQELALKNEEFNYVDQRFSRKKIASLTNLQGKALDDFVTGYRPGIAAIKGMSDYDLMVYIKKSYNSFLAQDKTIDKLDLVR